MRESEPVSNPDPGVKTNVSPTTGSSGKWDDDDLLRNITHEFEFEEEKGLTIYAKLQKILEDLILEIFKKG